MKTGLFAVVIGVALSVLPSLHAQQGSKARAALKTRIHQAVEEEDWIAVRNLEAALAKLDSSLGKTPVPKKATEPSKPKQADLFESMTKAGFSLLLAPDSDNPAKFAFTHDIQAGTKTYTADFFLEWKMPTSVAYDSGLTHDAWDLSPSASVQGKISSGDNSKTDAWRFRGTVKGRYTVNPLAQNPDTIFGFLWNASIKDEGSRDFDYNRLGGEFNITAVAPGIAMGKTKPDRTTDMNGEEVIPPFEFQWQPFLGFDAGTTTSKPVLSARGADDTLWLTARCSASLKLNALARALNFAEVSLFADDTFIHLAETNASHNYLKAGLNFMMTPNVGFSFDYTVGESSPKFLQEEIFAAAFTIRFK